MDTVITDVFEPEPEIYTDEDARIYSSKLSNLSPRELCTELSNVMSARHNVMITPSGLNDYSKNRKLQDDLIIRALAICVFVYGESSVFGYKDGEMGATCELMVNLDSQIAERDLDPSDHGLALIKRLGTFLMPNADPLLKIEEALGLITVDHDAENRKQQIVSELYDLEGNIVKSGKENR